MRRIASIVLLVVLALPLVLSGVLVVSFLVQKDRIARDLCVQREVNEAQRTCHGQCHLTKQFKAAEGADGPREPAQPAFRYEVQFMEQWAPFAINATEKEGTCSVDRAVAYPSDGFARGVEGVPWG